MVVIVGPFSVPGVDSFSVPAPESLGDLISSLERVLASGPWQGVEGFVDVPVEFTGFECVSFFNTDLLRYRFDYAGGCVFLGIDVRRKLVQVVASRAVGSLKMESVHDAFSRIVQGLLASVDVSFEDAVERSVSALYFEDKIFGGVTVDPGVVSFVNVPRLGERVHEMLVDGKGTGRIYSIDSSRRRVWRLSSSVSWKLVWKKV